MFVIKDNIIDLPLKMRESPTGSFETADALVFFVEILLKLNNLKVEKLLVCISLIILSNLKLFLK